MGYSFRDDCLLITACDDHVQIEAHHLCCQIGQQFSLAVRKAVLKDDCASVHVPELVHSMLKCVDEPHSLLPGADDEHPDACCASSINRPLALLRHLLRLARDEWGILAEAPRVKLEREPEGRIKWLESDEEARLLKACADSDNQQLLPIVTIALETGPDHAPAEVDAFPLHADDLPVPHPEVTKSGRRREVPMRQAV